MNFTQMAAKAMNDALDEELLHPRPRPKRARRYLWAWLAVEMVCTFAAVFAALVDDSPYFVGAYVGIGVFSACMFLLNLNDHRDSS